MLGTLSFELDGKLLQPNLGQRGCLFASYLIQFKGPHRRDYLVDLFWPDLTPEKARCAFNNATWRLRRLLELDPTVGGDRLRRIGDDLTLEHSAHLRADTHELSWAANRVMQHEKGEPLGPDEEIAAANSVQNYRGPFLEGMDFHWILPERGHLHELCVKIQNHLVRLSVSRGDHEGALIHAQRMAAVDPLNERVHGDLMLLLLLIGRQADAVRCYERLESLLRTELAIRPMPETQRLADLIKSGAVFGEINTLTASRFRLASIGGRNLTNAA